MKKQKVEKKQSDEDFKDEFKTFSIEQVKPIMNKYKEFLVSKGQQCQILVKSSNGYSKWDEQGFLIVLHKRRKFFELRLLLGYRLIDLNKFRWKI